MDSRATESEILELENKLMNPTAEPISLPLHFLRSITNDFSDKQELGSGGYGVVYKGILRCGSVIAVKKIHDTHLVDDEKFQNEASFLMGIKHQNVVQLLGYCAESKGVLTKLPDGRKHILAEILTRVICFEYVCNKGLDKHLSDESSGLDWNTRYKIIKGICSGLNFLHKCNVVHLDLKPQNILMDANMMPKVADFGLSRLLGEQKSYTVTTNRVGSIGYMAPEYINKGVISKKADIFSLGVIMIEILKGCKGDYPVYPQRTQTECQHFTEKVLSNWRNRFERASKYTALELHTQLVKQCIDIALQCVDHVLEKRPNVLNILEILNRAEGSCCVQNGKDLLVDHQMGSQEGMPVPPDVQQEDELAAPNRSVMKDYAPTRISEDIWNKETFGRAVDVVKSVVPEGSVLACAEGTLAALCYQGARNASFWVAHKVLASLEDNLLKDWATTINLGLTVEALEQELKSVKMILEIALGKVMHNLELEDILMGLRELVYDAEDVLDEMEYFRIQGDVLELNVLPSVHDEPPNLRFDRDSASRRIEHMVEQMQFMLQKVSSAIKLLGSDWNTAPNIAQTRPITISESTEPKLYGRELMMKRIIDDITKGGKHSREVLTVIPIVGPGGIGKTTLAQHIYHSGEVQEHFQVRVWTCVSLNFSVTKLTEEIERHIPKVDHEGSNDTASELIGQRLKNKRLLLVLDDIWDCDGEDEWKRLLVPFRKSQVHGNIIIVTTRLPAQAHIMVQKNEHSIYLQGIEKKEFEEFFLEIIFGDDDQSRKEHTILLQTGFKIAGRLKGSPLAAKTVGRLLKTKLDFVHWTRILESKEWEHSNGKNDIMPALKLSFDYLPSHLQQCFSYCALFPKDYEFERQELINFWIGLEVLHSSHAENIRVEDIGLSHLTELVNYGFLENKGGKDGRTCYIIHDLLHELAQKASSLECLSIDSSQSQVSSLEVLPSIRHLSLNIDGTTAKDRLTLKNCVEDFTTLGTRLKVEKLRTLMIFGEHHGYFVKAFGDLFREAKALRLVFLSGASYDVKDLLHNFCYLIHLRYLRIESSFQYPITFPNKISRFYHMMVLDATHCYNIIELPRDMSNLVKLRHFLVGDDAIHSTIFEVGKLKSLQELRRFVVKREAQGYELKEIGHLIDLCGSLSIDNLQNVQVKEEAYEAKLLLKRCLHKLILHWDNNDRSTTDSTLEEHVLERLMPSSNLVELSVIGHRGNTCPSWLGTNLSVKSLESLCLEGVAWKRITPIGELLRADLAPERYISGSMPDRRFGSLRRLELCKLTMVKKWVVPAPCRLFPFLEVIIVKDCPQLAELSFQHFGCCQQGKEVNVNLLPRLKKLGIRNCPQLSSFPSVPWNEDPCSICIEGTGSPSLDKLVCSNNYKYSLTIVGNQITTDRTFWNVLDFHNLTGLKELSMSSCQFLPLRYLQMLSSLRTLTVESLKLTAFLFVEADNHVKYQFPVESLTIHNWNGSGMVLTQLLTYFPKLSDLQLWKLNKVTGLGVNVKGQPATETPGPSSSANINKAKQQPVQLLLLPPQLQQLEIFFCTELSLRSDPRDDSNQNGQNEGGAGLQALTSLRRLKISDCPELFYSSSSFSSCFPFPNSLEYLDMFGAVGMDKRVSVSNLTSLKSLTLRLEYEDFRGGGFLPLLAQGHLTKLVLRGIPSLFVDPEPSQVHEQEIPSSSSKLQELAIEDVAGFTAAAIHRSLLFSSLTALEIYGDHKVERFTQEQEALLFVNSLEDISFKSCHNLQSLPDWLHRLPILKRLHIWGCQAIQLPPKDGLPSSLEELYIWDCPKIQSLPKDCLPDSLQTLKIQYCPAIQSLPEVDDLPSSLRELDVRDSKSEELRSQCRKLINIIPIVKA